MELIQFGKGATTMGFDSLKGFLEQINYNGETIFLHSRLWTIQSEDKEITVSDMESFKVEE